MSACLPDAKLNGLCNREIESVRKASLLLCLCPVGVNLMHLHAARASLFLSSVFYMPLSDTVNMAYGSNHDQCPNVALPLLPYCMCFCMLGSTCPSHYIPSHSPCYSVLLSEVVKIVEKRKKRNRKWEKMRETRNHAGASATR